MKQAVAAAACLLALACSSSGVTIRQPDIEFVQLVGPAEQNYPAGEIEVQYGMRIANRASESITLMRVRVEPFGTGGPYEVLRDTYNFNRAIAPDQSSDVTFWAKAVAAGNRFKIDATAPVGVRAVAYFNSPGGQFRKVVTANFTQTGRVE